MSQHPFFSRKDAANKHKANKDQHVLDTQAIAQQLFELVSAAYMRSKCYLTARQHFISVKVASPTQADRIQSAVDIDTITAFVVLYDITSTTSKDGHLLYQVKHCVS